MEKEPRSAHRGGLFGSLRRLLDTTIGIVGTRLELLSTEVAEERLNLARMVVVALGALFCLQVGVILAVLFAVLVVGTGDRLTAIGIAALVLLLVGLVGLLWLWRWLKTRPPVFATTLAELRKDRERLGRGR
jgi:uncharacterized membrane protein YqjE